MPYEEDDSNLNVVKHERRYGDFTMTFTIPETYERKWVSCHVEKGVLCMRFKQDVSEATASVETAGTADPSEGSKPSPRAATTRQATTQAQQQAAEPACGSNAGAASLVHEEKGSAGIVSVASGCSGRQDDPTAVTVAVANAVML